MSLQRVLKTAAPGEAQFGIDVDDCHAGLDCLLEILVTGSGTAVQSHENVGHCLDFGNSLDIQTRLGFTVNHALQQPVHISDCRRQHVNVGRIDELLCLFRSREHAYSFGSFL